MNRKDILVISNFLDCYFAIELAYLFDQQYEISDVINLKTFANSEFCPRFTLSDENDYENTGNSLAGKTIILVSTTNHYMTRNELAMRNLVISRAAKDNGAEKVILVEPDLFYSAQDRGPRWDLGKTDFKRDSQDLKKFDGQPFTAKLYAELLYTAGVDKVITVHNHSHATIHEYARMFGNDNIVNLFPDWLYHQYLEDSGVVDSKNTVLVAPDNGAVKFVEDVATSGDYKFPYIIFDKERDGERKVHSQLSGKSPHSLEFVKGKDVVILDDLVRTGSTINEACRLLSGYNPSKIVFQVTHFYTSQETRENLDKDYISDVVTTNTLPSILDRNNQGRLRKKIAILKITRWIAHYLNHDLELGLDLNKPYYEEEMSGKNHRAAEEKKSVFV